MTASALPPASTDARAQSIVDCIDALQRAASRLGLRRDEADEVVQQALLFAWARRDEIDFTRPLVPYLARVLMFETRKLRTSASRRPDRDRAAELAADDPSLDAQRRELREGLATLIEQLPSAQRRVLQLRLRYDMEPHEIAAQLDCAPGAVRVSLHRGMSRLRTLLPRGWSVAVLPWFGWRDPRAPRHGVASGLATLTAAALVLCSVSMRWVSSGDVGPAARGHDRTAVADVVAAADRLPAARPFVVAAPVGRSELGAAMASLESLPAVVGSSRGATLDVASGANSLPDGLSLDAGPWAERHAAAVAADPRGRALVFGGRPSRLSNGFSSPWLDDGWLLHGGTAQRLQGEQPPGRSNAAMVYDEERRQFVMFGGRRGRFDLQDTWVFDDAGWRELVPRHQPPARHFASFVYDQTQQLAVLHGGTHGAEATRDDTWVWNGTDWSPLSLADGPSPRRGAAMAFDAVRGVSVLYGGCDHLARPLFDTWELSAQGWCASPAATNPGERNWHAMTFDPALGLVVLQGGLGGPRSRPRGDAWLFDGVDWIGTTSRASEPRAGHALVYDPIRRSPVALGNVPFRGGSVNRAAAIAVTSPALTVSVHELVLVRRATDGESAPMLIVDALCDSAMLDGEVCLDGQQLDTLLKGNLLVDAPYWFQRVHITGSRVSAGPIERR